MSVDLVPKNLVVGVLAPSLISPLPGAVKLSGKQFRAVYADLADQYGYRSLTVAAEDAGCQIVGASPADAINVNTNPPIIQILQDIQQDLDLQAPARKAEHILEVIAARLGISQMIQLGVRVLYHGALPTGNGKAFVRGRLLGRTADDFQHLRVTGDDVWVGLKLITDQVGTTYTLQVEPLNADPSMIYVDVDAQTPGPVVLNTVQQKVLAVHTYVAECVREYLNAAGA